MDEFIKYFSNIYHVSHWDQDFIDRINTKYVCYLFLFIGITLFSNEYGTSPFKCWTPANYPSSWDQYVENYCYVQGNTFVNLSAKYPKEIFHEPEKIHYYQSLSLAFILASFFLHLPRIFWSASYPTSHFYFTQFCKAAHFHRTKKFQKSLQIFDRAIYSHYSMTSFLFRFVAPDWLINYFQKRVLIFYYCIFKVWTISNIVIMQLFVSFFLIDDQTDIFGVRSFFTIISGNDWKNTGLFPRVAACKLDIRKMGIFYDNIQPKVVDCGLKANMFLEKFFLFSCVFHIVLFFLTISSLFIWIQELRSSKQYLKDLIVSNTQYDFSTLRHQVLVELFIHLYLTDGLFVIRMLGKPAAIYTAQALYLNFIKKTDIGKRVLKAQEDDLLAIVEEFLR